MTVLVVMGVSGSGKTAVGSAVAERLGWTFVDADDHHPAANRTKMARGVPLTDADRLPWLDELNAVLVDADQTVLACSALKAAYRRRLLDGAARSVVVYLQVDRDVALARVGHRHGHFMPPSLVASQFAALEVPGEQDAVTIDATRPLDDVVEAVVGYVT